VLPERSKVLRLRVVPDAVPGADTSGWLRTTSFRLLARSRSSPLIVVVVPASLDACPTMSMRGIMVSTPEGIAVSSLANADVMSKAEIAQARTARSGSGVRRWRASMPRPGMQSCAANLFMWSLSGKRVIGYVLSQWEDS